MTEPTAAQIDEYRRDGFLVVERFLDADWLEGVRDRFKAVFEHDWETGLAPDEVNDTPGVTAPERTRQLCNVWKADRVLAGVTLAERTGRWTSALASLPGARVAQDNAIWEPYVAGSHRWPHTSLGGTFHAPDDWLAHVRQAMPAGAERALVPIEVPAGGAAFHDGWTFHGSPVNQRTDADRRSIISHMISSATRWNPAAAHPVYSRYRRPGELELDEAFFPILWRDGYRSPWIDTYVAGAS